MRLFLFHCDTHGCWISQSSRKCKQPLKILHYILLFFLSTFILEQNAYSDELTQVYITLPSCETDDSYCKTEAEKEAAHKKREELKRQSDAKKLLMEQERKAKEAELKKFTDQYGQHRQAEAENLRKMRMEAEAAKNNTAEWGRAEELLKKKKPLVVPCPPNKHCVSKQ